MENYVFKHIISISKGIVINLSQEFLINVEKEATAKMKKSAKWLLFILLLLTLTILWPNVVNYQSVSNFPKLKALESYPWIADYIPHYVFWGTIVLAAILVIAFLVTLFIPTQKDGVELEDNQGKLVVKAAAVEGLVQSILSSQRAIQSSSTKVRMYKDKVKVDITGSLRRTSNLYGQSNQIAQRVQKEVNDFLGQGYPAEVQVEFNDVSEQTENHQTESRVI